MIWCQISNNFTRPICNQKLSNSNPIFKFFFQRKAKQANEREFKYQVIEYKQFVEQFLTNFRITSK